MRQEKGFSLVETLLAGALGSIVLLILVSLTFRMVKFISRNQARQSAAMQARACLETIERFMSNGKANTLQISTPNTTPTVPNSRAQFLTVDGSSYTITWSTAPPN